MSASRTSFHGSFAGGGSSIVLAILEGWLETKDLRHRDRMGGYEIWYETDEVYIYCQESRTDEHLLEGHLAVALEGAEERLRPLRRLSDERGVKLRLEYVAIDDEGNEIGDEVSLA